MSRIDYELIEGLVPEGATVLDLACGDGGLLAELVREKHVHGSGLEISQAAVEACVGKGLSVFHGDLDEGLADFPDDSHDVVILSLSLQQLKRPRMIIREMVRIGRLAIVSFPNFAHWGVRAQLFLQLARQGIARALARLDRAAGQSPEAVAVQLVQQHPSAVGDEGCGAVAQTPGWSGWRQAWVRHGKSAWGEGQQRGDPIHLRPLVHSRRRSA